MKIIKSILIMLFMTTGLMANYTIIETKTAPGVHCEKEIFFGKLADYSKYVSEVQKNLAARGSLGAIDGMSKGAQALAKGFYGEALKGVTAGAGIGIAVAMLNPYVMSFYADQEYVLIRTNGKKELEAIIFIGDKHPSLSEDKIHSILRKK